MNLFVEFVFAASLILLIYAYIGYPLFVGLMARFFERRIRPAPFEPLVTIIITAYNEERDIRAKIENTLALQYPASKLEIIVASDGSSDRTDEIVREFASKGVALFRQEGRVGKTETQNNAIRTARGDIVVFSDATTMFRRDVLAKLLPNFADPLVGCVTGKLVYVDESNSSVGTGAKRYWNYETFLKSSESKVCSIIGASGCMYAIRRAAYEPMYVEACSDFLICTLLYRKKLRSVFEENAICFEETNRRSDDEFKMRVRIIAQTFTDLWRNTDMMNPFKSGFFAVQLVSHKIIRYSVPWLLLSAFFSSLYLATFSPFYLFAFAVQITFYFCAAVGWLLAKNGVRSGMLVVPFYFVLGNIAAAAGLIKFIKGNRFAQWEPARKQI